MDDYDHRPGGTLKLKGGVIDGGVSKKKKKPSKSKSKDKQREVNPEALLKEEGRVRTESPVGSSRNSPAAASLTDKKTAAERRFEETRKQRLAEKAAKQAYMTHKDRVHEFNSKLEALSEHHDIPKVGPG